jgi:hypothetical protein
VSWDSGPNVLNARLSAQFGVAHVDRGREYIRQGLASWRKYSGLSYTEVADTHVAFSQSTSNVGGGDVRIGSTTQGNSGVLAYNYFPNGGGDMVINADELNGGSMFSGSANYRYFRNVVAHEHGHGLGFFHPTPCNGTKLMEPFANTNFEMTQVDELRGAQRNYGDRLAGNNSAGNAKDFGNLTTPSVRSVIERNLSTNGASGPNNTNQDWFRFTLGTSQNVVITAAPTGGSYANGQQTGGCNPTNPATVNAAQAGNLNIELRDSTGNTIIQQANAAAAGSTETITANGLAAGTYTVRVVDVGPNSSANQFVQLYDFTLRVGTSKAPPVAIAGLPKRVAAGQVCYFMGDLNSRVTEQGAALNNASYDWDLDGDGVFETTDQPQPTFVYNGNGLFNATLRVTDSNGMSSTDTISVAVVGAVSTISAVTPNTGQTGATIPVTITGTNLGGVTSAAQVNVGSGITVSGTPVVSGGGTTVTGLSFVISVGAATGLRTVTISNADGTGQVAESVGAFTVNNAPPSNDTCAAPISWGSLSGARPFSNINATTGTPQSFPSTGCPAAGPINNDVWYTWTAPSNGNLSVTTDSATAGSPSVFSSRVAVYNGTACPPTTVLGCDDFGTTFNVFVIGGQTYLFQVGSVIVGQSGSANVVLTFFPLLGACCDSSGGCSITPSNQCLGSSVWRGTGTTCEVPGCPPPAGTCCSETGDCEITDVGSCTGVFVPGGSCNPNPCQAPTGSCCGTDGSCIETAQADCAGGSTWTQGAVCDPNPCAPLSGACCDPDGSCAVSSESSCTGTWEGASTTCTPNPCPQPPTGACCSSITCAIATQAECTGVFQGAGTACGPTGNPTTCCPANFNQQNGVTVQDIFDFLAAYFGGQPQADFNGAGGISVQDIFDYLAAYFTGCPG